MPARGACAVKALMVSCTVHSTQQHLIPHSGKRRWRHSLSSSGKGTSSLGCGAGIGAESGHFHLGQPCLPLTLVGAGALGAVPTSGPAGRSWQG